MSAIDRFAERARSVARTIVLPEGQDPRVVIAANKAVDEKVVKNIIVLGSEEEISAAFGELHCLLRGLLGLKKLEDPVAGRHSVHSYVEIAAEPSHGEEEIR